MTNRRAFLQMGGTTLGLMTIPHVVLSATLHQPPQTSYTRVIFDKRFKASRAFASQAAFSGIKTTGLDDEDVSALWYDDLRRELQRNPGTIAGMTTESSAFCMEILSHDVFHRQVSSVRYENGLVSWVISPVRHIQT